jgi:hypothetical protein
MEVGWLNACLATERERMIDRDCKRTQRSTHGDSERKQSDNERKPCNGESKYGGSKSKYAHSKSNRVGPHLIHIN